MAEIEFDSVTKRYPDGTDAIRGIDLKIADGELMVLVGPSGCGKTTALRMIAGLEEITAGQLRIGGRVVNHTPPKQRDVAMVFQSYALYPHMSVRKNMGFALRLAKVPKADIERRVRETAEILDLTEHLDRKPANLSGGQRQRVAMGRAIVRDPQAFLMDEPLSNLDAKLRVQMRLEVAGLQKRLGTTTVYVTHDQTEAMTLGHRVAVMHEGLIQQVDTPQRLYTDPANLFVAGFIGSPPMNLLPAKLKGDRLELPFGELRLPEPLLTRLDRARTGGEVIAGIRPEAFAHATPSGEHDVPLAFGARIDLVELLGAETFVYFYTEEVNGTRGARPVVARLPASAMVRQGQETRLSLDPAGIRLFDGSTGETMVSPDGDAVSSPNGRLDGPSWDADAERSDAGGSHATKQAM
jgi:multiple sugar transport system ATP-binding protein